MVAVTEDMEFSLWGVLRQAMPLIALYAVAELGAGAVFSRISEKILLVPGLLVLVPAIMNLRGAISSALGARLGSAYHMGLIDPDEGLNDEILENFKASVFLTVVISVFRAFVAFAFCIILDLAHITLVQFILISVGVGIVASAIMLSFTYFVAITAAKMGLDPDNVVIPAVATIGDVVTLSVTLVIVLVVMG